MRERARPARRGRPRRPARADLRLAGHRHEGGVHVPRAPRRRSRASRGARGAGRRARRPGDRLHADGSGGARRDARLRADRGRALGRLRRLRGERARDAYRGRAAEGRRLRLVRDRAGADRRVQAAARRGDRASSRGSRIAASSSSAPMLEAELDPARDLEWHEALAGAEPADCVPLAATDPLYIIYTSGTTGQPKGIVRDNGGHAVALAWSMKNIYDTDPGEVYWAASDIGWTVGHSYTVYGPLLHGCTTVLYEGKPVGTPDAGAFWRVCAEHGVSTLFTAPTAFRAIRQQDPDGEHIGRYDLSKLRALFLAGERCDPETLRWAEDKLGIPVIDHYWQTETGWPVAANCLGIERLPVIPGSPTRAVPGWDVRVLDEGGAERPPGEIGALVVKLPMPPGSSPTLWNAEERYRETYLDHVPRLLPDRRRRLPRRRGLRLRHGPHRRHHQHRRPPPLDRRDGGGACCAPGRRRVRGDRRRGRPEGPAAASASSSSKRASTGRTTRSSRRGRAARCASGSARSPRSRPRSSSSGCRRRARGRSCAGRCAGSPTASRTRPLRRSTIPTLLDDVSEALRTIGYSKVPVSSG